MVLDTGAFLQLRLGNSTFVAVGNGRTRNQNLSFEFQYCSLVNFVGRFKVGTFYDARRRGEVYL